MNSRMLNGLTKKAKLFFLEFISFNSSRAIVINLSFIIFLLFILPTEFLKYLPIRPVFKDFLLPFLFNGHCPTSGFLKDCSVYSTGETRGISRLLHGDITGAYNYNPLVFLVIIVMIILIVINIMKIVNTKKK